MTLTLQQQPLTAPRSSSYMLMLNSYASDLESILSDLSVSPPPGDHVDGEEADPSSTDHASVQRKAANQAEFVSLGNSDVIREGHASCPNLTCRETVRNGDEVDTSITLLERMIRSHPIWYLPALQRSEAVQLLQHQQSGVFIVRQSSQPGTLALSVKLSTTVDKSGIAVQHYLIEAAPSSGSQEQTGLNAGVRLEASDFIFENLPSLLEHYCRCCDELPVQLQLPPRLIHAPSRTELNSLARLGKDFWNTQSVSVVTRKTPPVPPLRLSTFDPFVTLQQNNEKNAAPSADVDRESITKDISIEDDAESSNSSPRLEAKRVEPEAPPPPPRWCKPTHLKVHREVETVTLTFTVTEQTTEEPRRRRRRRLSDGKDPAPHCRSSLADKTSDYEDLWANSPLEETTPEQTMEAENEEINEEAEKEEINEETIEVEEAKEEKEKVEEIEIVEEKAEKEDIVHNDCTQNEEEVNNDLEDKENRNSIMQEENSDPPIVILRNAEPTKDSSRRTSPLYSEPADAIPLVPWWLKNNQRPLPVVPPFPGDGYVKCWGQPSARRAPPRVKQVAPPSLPVAPRNNTRNSRIFPSVSVQADDHQVTLQQVLNRLCPSLKPPTLSSSEERVFLQRVSAYDNMTDVEDDALSNDGTVTEFSEPWDSARWDQLLTPVNRGPQSSVQQQQNTLKTIVSSDGGIGTLSEPATLSRPPSPRDNAAIRLSNRDRLNRTKSFKDKMDPLLASPRLQAFRGACSSTSGQALHSFMLELGADSSTTFGSSLQHFVQCTREGKEQRASAVMRNVRQFMSGIKNFLLQHGEAAFDRKVEQLRTQLKHNEFLNLDAVLESALHRLVTHPLRLHIYKLLSAEAIASGSVQQLLAGIKIAREISPYCLGLREGHSLPDPEKAAESLERLQQATSPQEKLDHLLNACSAIYDHAAETCGEGVAAEDFLPLLAWLFARTGFVTAEQEADYVWALLHPSLLAGEGGYFLTALSSAAQLLKNLHTQQQLRPSSPSDCSGSWMGTLTSLPDAGSANGGTGPQPCVLRVLVADEAQGSLIARTLPLRPAMTVKDVVKLLSLKLRLPNPQDFTLVALIEGQETVLSESEMPQSVLAGAAASGRHCTFAFRPQDAKIAWPQHLEA